MGGTGPPHWGGGDGVLHRGFMTSAVRAYKGVRRGKAIKGGTKKKKMFGMGVGSDRMVGRKPEEAGALDEPRLPGPKLFRAFSRGQNAWNGSCGEACGGGGRAAAGQNTQNGLITEGLVGGLLGFFDLRPFVPPSGNSCYRRKGGPRPDGFIF